MAVLFFRSIMSQSDVFKKPISYFEDDDLYCADNSSYRLTEKKVYEILSSLPAVKKIGVQGEAKTDYFNFSLYYQAEEFLPVMLEGNTQPFAIKITSTEACPWASKDEYILCVPTTEIQNGKLYLVKTKKGYTIKKVYQKEETTKLKYFDNKTELFKNSEIKIFAQVLAFYRKPL